MLLLHEEQFSERIGGKKQVMHLAGFEPSATNIQIDNTVLCTNNCTEIDKSSLYAKQSSQGEREVP